MLRDRTQGDRMQADRMQGDRRIPMIIERGDPSRPGVDLYTAMLGARIVFVADTLDATAAMDVSAQLLFLDADGSDRDISLYLRGNTGSGATTEAMTIVYDAIRSVGCDVQTVCLGQATATIAVLLAAGTPGKRMVAPSARVVLEEPTSPERTGRADDLAVQAAEIRRERDLMIKLLGDHTGQSIDRLDADLRRPTVLTATEAIAYGLADHLVATRDRRSTTAAR
jgi:ATP-dependent Clp protease protease subunit